MAESKPDANKPVPPKGAPADQELGPPQRSAEWPDDFGGVGPAAPPFVDIPNFDNLPCGLYITYGATGGGKSITTAAIAHMSAQAGYPSGYLYLYEARAQPGFFTDSEGLSKLEVTADRFLSLLRDKTSRDQAPTYRSWISYGLDKFWNNLGKTSKSDKTASLWVGKPGVLVIDSITIPLRTHAAVVDSTSKGRKGEATMEGGLQPSDIDFVVRLNAFAVDKGIVLIGVVNLDLVPFAQKLEAMCEGMISVTGPGKVLIRHRSKRVFRQLLLPQVSLDFAATVLLRYDKDAKRDKFGLMMPFGSQIRLNS